MSPVFGILALAGLFAVFGLVFRGREQRSCQAPAPHDRDASCSSCPLHEVNHD